MDDCRLLLSDTTWALWDTVLRSVKHPAGAPAELSERDFVEALLYRARTGCPWRDLPSRFGDWNAVYQRFRRWEKAGVWQGLFARLPAEAGLLPLKRLFFDSTTVRAHPHAAGAPRKKGGKPNRRSVAVGVASRRKSTWPAAMSAPPLPRT
jgi:transposase